MDLTKISVRTFADFLPKKTVDGIYLFGQTYVNQYSVLDQAIALYKQHKIRTIFLFESDGMSGYPGHAPWINYLIQSNIPDSAIELINPGKSDLIHTRIESEALITHSIRKNYQEIIICSSPFHQLRAFITAISVILEKNAAVKVYSKPGFTQAWSENVNHSQGVVTGSRSTLLVGELERIFKYQKMGDLESFEAIWNYLINRDNQPNKSNKI